MGNCCAVPSTTYNDSENKTGKNKPNLFAIDNGGSIPSGNGYKPYVLENPSGNQIEQTYVLGRELGRGEFGVTYLWTDVRREVEIMKHMPPHPNIVSLKDTYEDDGAVHLVMELCEGGELFDRIVARGHYTERAAAVKPLLSLFW
ncbi:putative protein kinase CAMK-CDPK family [Helianthus annuus]|nr:putative protein kinase CAMK-CDPK family [Helianthus annuus]